MKPKIVVIGSANTDMIVSTAHIPQAGETILGDHFMQSMGGKGANQAVAAARLGAEVTFIARLGRDSFGQGAFNAYEKEGIDTRYIVWDEETPSGVALIMIDSEGENIICVAPGANGNLSTEDILKAEEAIKCADCVLLQLEVPILNPAPMAKLSKSMLKMVDILTPNETEVTALTGTQASDPRELWAMIKTEYGVKDVIVTMGKEGAYITGVSSPNVPAFHVESVDATGAGDAFNGGLAVALSRGDCLEDAVRYANAVGALATTRLGAQSSLPNVLEVEAFLKANAESQGSSGRGVPYAPGI
jgi:ribokinase